MTWDQTNDIITYTGVSLVKDTDTTNDYQFGYFDVHVNGSDYGVAQNPYTITNTDKGGDGFDIAWAVDSNGAPAGLSHITKVRVYTAAALTSNGTAFTTPSIFGETSAEFCGIFATSNTISGGAGTTAAPTSVSIDNLTITPATNANVESRGNNVYYYHTTGGVSEAVITVAAASGANVFINGTAGTSLELSENTEVVQILVQSGNAAPYILVID